MVPALAWLRDVTQAGDALGSFLAVDRGVQLSRIAHPDLASAFGRGKIHEMVVKEVEHLSEVPNSVLPWRLLRLLLGDLPLYDDIIDNLRLVLERVELVSLVERDQVHGVLAIRVAADVAGHIADGSLLQRLRGQLIDAARALARLYPDSSTVLGSGGITSDDLELAALSLLESTLALSCAQQSEADEGLGMFAHTMGELAAVWPQAAGVYERSIQECCGQLPTKLSIHLWPLLVRLRTA